MNWKILSFAAMIASLSACQQNTVQSQCAVPNPFTIGPVNQKVMPEAKRFAEYDLVDGDILLPVRTSTTRARATPQGNRVYNTWPRGIVPYQFDAQVNADVRQKVISAMEPWKMRGISFVAQTNETVFVTITQDPFPLQRYICGATLGYQTSEPNRYAAGSQCRTRDFVHEWGHVLGLHHEHQRPDRDQYITVQPDGYNGLAGATYGAYDFNSIMHYDAFNRNKETGAVDYQDVLYRPLDGRDLMSFGWNETPSEGDLRTVRCLYP